MDKITIVITLHFNVLEPEKKLGLLESGADARALKNWLGFGPCIKWVCPTLLDLHF